jgi:hypothetical protein
MKLRKQEKNFYRKPDKNGIVKTKNTRNGWFIVFTIVNFLVSLFLSTTIVKITFDLKKSFGESEPSQFSKEAKSLFIEVWTKKIDNWIELIEFSQIGRYMEIYFILFMVIYFYKSVI